MEQMFYDELEVNSLNNESPNELMIIKESQMKTDFLSGEDFEAMDRLIKLLKQDYLVLLMILMATSLVSIGILMYLAFLTSVHPLIVLGVSIVDLVCILALNKLYSKYSSISSKSFSRRQYGKISSVYKPSRKDRKFVNLYRFPRIADVEFPSYMDLSTRKIVYNRVLLKGVYCNSPSIVEGDSVLVFHLKNGKSYGMRIKNKFN